MSTYRIPPQMIFSIANGGARSWASLSLPLAGGRGRYAKQEGDDPDD